MDYMTNIMAMSDAKSVCYIGPFLGGTADVIWKKIKPLGKELYLVDNYLFIPESKREHFFSKVKDQIDPDSERELWSELRPWLKQRIVIAISHRAQTLKFADRHFVLDAGVLTEML